MHCAAEGIFTSGVYIFHELETSGEGRGELTFAVSPFSNQLPKFKHKITTKEKREVARGGIVFEKLEMSSGRRTIDLHFNFG